MKRILSLLTVLALALGLASCAKVRNTPPQFKGLVKVVEVDVNASYDPLQDLTAIDAEDGDLTDKIQIEGFNPEWLKKVGVYSYNVYVEDKSGLSAEETITLKVGNASVMMVGLQTGQSYYIGSKDFDPIRGVKAYDTTDKDNPVDITDRITYDKGDYNLARTGRYTITVSVENDKGEVTSQTISLNVKQLSTAIPNELTKDPITITLWHSNGDTIDAAVKTYAQNFMALYPNITVNIVKQANTYSELRDLTIKAIQGGTLPNIIQGYPDHVMEYIDNKALIPMTPYMDHPVHGFSDAEPFTDILINYRQENSQYSADGEYYSMPFNKSTEVTIYNKDLFDELIETGIITEFPKTWQDLFALAPEIMKIKDKHIDKIMEGLNANDNKTLHKTPEQIAEIKAKFVPFSYDSEDNAFITLLRQWGGAYTSIDSSRGGVLNFKTTSEVQTTNMLDFVYENRNVFTIPGFWQTNYASDPFKLGQTVVTIGSTGGTRYNTPEVNTFNLGIAPMLYNKDMPQNAAAIQQGTNLSVTSSGTQDQKLAAWYFVKYLASAEVQLDFSLKTGYQPVRQQVYSMPEFLNFIAGKDEDGKPLTGENLTKSLGANAAALQNNILFYDQAFVGSSKAREAVGVAFSRVSLSTSTNKATEIKNAIQYAYDEAKRVLGN